MGGNTATTQSTAEMIDLSAAAPAWTALPDLNVPRDQQFTATLLPDGRVFIAGGVSGGADGGVCEIFDPRNPATGWVIGPAMKYVRTYHSSFILLADGSVLGWRRPAGRRRADPARALLSRLLRHAAPGREQRPGYDQLRLRISPSTPRTGRHHRSRAVAPRRCHAWLQHVAAWHRMRGGWRWAPAPWTSRHHRRPTWRRRAGICCSS